jgi:hypothetical protein
LEVCAIVEGFLASVLLKGRSVLNARRQVIDTRYRLNRYTWFERCLAELSQLSGIIGSEIKNHD